LHPRARGIGRLAEDHRGGFIQVEPTPGYGTIE
jgi:hypothetical protein